MAREYLPKVKTLYRTWRNWQAIWTWANILLGGTSTALGALVAANTKSNFLDDKWAITTSILAPVLTFILTALRPQSKATAFETASREIEKVRNRYEVDPTLDDVFLCEGVERGIDLLNRIGSS